VPKLGAFFWRLKQPFLLETLILVKHFIKNIPVPNFGPKIKKID